MPFKAHLQNFKRTVWARVVWRVIKEVAIPFGMAFLSAWYSMKVKPVWTWAEAFQVFSTTFVAVGFFTGYVLRSHKLVKDEDRHSDVISKQDGLLKQMEETAKAVASYSTGGDSFVAMTSVEVGDSDIGKLIYELCYMVEGGYPLYDVTVRIFDVDNPAVATAISRGDPRVEDERMLLGNMVPGFAYVIRAHFPVSEDKPTRLVASWRARNGRWYQRFEIRHVAGQWETATFVKRGGCEILVRASEGFERDVNGRPSFDMSPTALERASPDQS